MKRFICFMCVIFVLVALGLDSGGLLQIEGKRAATYYFYVEGNIIECPIAEARSLKRDLRAANIDGESIRYAGGEEELDYLIKLFGVRIEKSETLEGITILYGYSPHIGNGLILEGARINIQLAYRDGYVYAGTPVILGSY